MIYVTGPGHGARPWWQRMARGHVQRGLSRDHAGRGGHAQAVRQFSFPGGIPSHVAPETPGSIHEGGELGYSLAHAYGAAFDNPDLVVACVVGDGEAETGPLATSWHSNKFLEPATRRRRPADPAPERYKIANPTVLARIPRDELDLALRGLRIQAHMSKAVDGEDPRPCTSVRRGAGRRPGRDRRNPAAAHASEGDAERPRWPMIVLRTPKGWTGPKEVDGKPVEGTWRSHQVPLADVRDNPEHLRVLEEWMRSYRPEELFDDRTAHWCRSSRRSLRWASAG